MGEYELKETMDGQYHFVLKASNGEVIAQSEMYTTKNAALNGIESVRKNAPDARLVDKTTA